MNLRKTVDMTGRETTFSYPPRRIVSLVPSQTELLCDLGLDAEVVGITKFCVHPEKWFRNKTRIGGTKNINIEKILALQPDLVIANKEENEKAQVEVLAQSCPVWVSDINDLGGALEMIEAVGMLTGKEEVATGLVSDIAKGFKMLQGSKIPKRVAYFIWRDPWMSVGRDTFISSMINAIGWQNVLEDKIRYPEIKLQELKAYNPELILLSSEPYPFKEQHIAEIKAVIPMANIILVDGEMFSWYGSRLLKAIGYLEDLTKAI